MEGCNYSHSRGTLYVVGTGPGGLKHITPAATDAIADSQVVVVKTKSGRLKGAINLWKLFKAVKQSVLKDDNLKADGQVDWDQQFANACLICTQLRLDEHIITDPPLLRPNDPILVVLDVFLKSRRDWALVVEGEKVMGVVYVTDVYREMTRDMVQIFK